MVRNWHILYHSNKRNQRQLQKSFNILTFFLQLRLTLLLGLAALASCDLPVDCSYADSLGTWEYIETERNGDKSIDCSDVGVAAYTKQFTLEYPDLVTDELGHTGTWTLIYNQGFEVGNSTWLVIHPSFFLIFDVHIEIIMLPNSKNIYFWIIELLFSLQN